MDALDQKLEDICFRSEKAAELLGKQPEDQVTEEDIIKLACHEQGGRKGCPKQAEYIVVLNKADTKERRDRACKIAKCLAVTMASLLIIMEPTTALIIIYHTQCFLVESISK